MPLVGTEWEENIGDQRRKDEGQRTKDNGQSNNWLVVVFFRAAATMRRRRDVVKWGILCFRYRYR